MNRLPLKWADTATKNAAVNAPLTAATGIPSEVNLKSKIGNAYEINQNNWGVCGFVAAFQAAYYNHKEGVYLADSSYDTLFPLIKQFCSNSSPLSRYNSASK